MVRCDVRQLTPLPPAARKVRAYWVSTRLGDRTALVIDHRVIGISGDAPDLPPRRIFGSIMLPPARIRLSAPRHSAALAGLDMRAVMRWMLRGPVRGGEDPGGPARSLP